MNQQKSWVVSVNVGPGGVPRFPRHQGDVLGELGFEHDERAFQKHNKPTRAVSVLSMELLSALQSEGYPVFPGAMAENLTVCGADLPAMQPGTRMLFENGTEIEVTGQRKPCYQLNPIREGLEHAAEGRAGVMCSVVKGGEIKPGMGFEVLVPATV